MRASSREDDDETEKNVPLERDRGRDARVRDVETTTDGRIDCAATRAGDEETHPRVRMRIISLNRKSMDPVV